MFGIKICVQYTFWTKPDIFSAVFLPIKPVPMTPATLSCNKMHCNPQMVKSAFLVSSYDFWRFLDNVKIEDTAYSAMLEGE